MAALLMAYMQNPSAHPTFDAANQSKPLKPFQWAVFVAGFSSVDPSHAAAWDQKIQGKCLHVLGRGDGIMGEDRTLPFLTRFESPRVEWHDGSVASRCQKFCKPFDADFAVSVDIMCPLRHHGESSSNSTLLLGATMPFLAPEDPRTPPTTHHHHISNTASHLGSIGMYQSNNTKAMIDSRFCGHGQHY